jgi:hypothetical protein
LIQQMPDAIKPGTFLDRITPISNVPLPRLLQAPLQRRPWAAVLQDDAIGILQLNTSSPSRKGAAGPDRAVSA